MSQEPENGDEEGVDDGDEGLYVGFCFWLVFGDFFVFWIFFGTGCRAISRDILGTVERENGGNNGGAGRRLKV